MPIDNTRLATLSAHKVMPAMLAHSMPRTDTGQRRVWRTTRAFHHGCTRWARP